MHFDIPELKGDHYKVWKEKVLLQLGCMDIDYVIRKDEAPAIKESSKPDKTKIHVGILGSIEMHESVKDLLKAIDEQFATSDKALSSTLIMEFSSLRLTTVKGVQEHIMKMRYIAARLKKIEVELSDNFLVHFIL
ncbi:uncharacterized protein [Henckelia pumila]|uniref:uncharacterized protein n=1 Tax=Henckelia pumila TaxID=405737 RepID=UPI003C6E9FE9